MQKGRGGPGRRQRRGNLSADQSGLPHAGHDDAAARVGNEPNGTRELVADP